MSTENKDIRMDLFDFIGWVHLNEMNSLQNFNQTFTKNTERYGQYDAVRDQDQALIEIKLNSSEGRYDQIKANDFYELIKNTDKARLLIINHSNSRIYDLNEIYENKEFIYTEEQRHVIGTDKSKGLKTEKMIYLDRLSDNINRYCRHIDVGTKHTVSSIYLPSLLKEIHTMDYEQIDTIYTNLKNQFPKYEFNEYQY